MSRDGGVAAAAPSLDPVLGTVLDRFASDLAPLLGLVLDSIARLLRPEGRAPDRHRSPLALTAAPAASARAPSERATQVWRVRAVMPKNLAKTEWVGSVFRRPSTAARFSSGEKTGRTAAGLRGRRAGTCSGGRVPT